LGDIDGRAGMRNSFGTVTEIQFIGTAKNMA
jgi:hypothetical protein